jgi:uncharacterized phage-associated protein
MFDEAKAAAMTSYFIDALGVDSIDILRLMKLLYLAERESLQEDVALMIGDEFVSMRLGPVLSTTYNCIKGQVSCAVWNQFFGPRQGNSVIRKANLPPARLLTKSEIQILERVWKTVGHLSTPALVNYVHDNCPEWVKPPEGKSSSPMPLEIVLERALGVNPAVAKSQANMIRSANGMRRWAKTFGDGG